MWSWIKRLFKKPVVAPEVPIAEPIEIVDPPDQIYVNRGNPSNPDWFFLWNTIEIDSKVLPELKRITDIILLNKSKYLQVEFKTLIPWYFVAALHYRESSLDFHSCLHNGDPLPGPTTHVPKGRGPFKSWEDAAIDAIKYDGLDKVKYESPAICLMMAEKFNGLGYRKTGEYSPYVLAGSNHHDETGKYVRDGFFDSSAKEKQLGVAVIMKSLLG